MVTAVLEVMVLLLIIALIVAMVWGSGVVHVNDSVLSPLPLATTEQRVFGPLGSIAGTSMTQVSPQQYAVVRRRAYPWAAVCAVVFFPVGLLLLLLRQELVLNVRLATEGANTTVQVSGRSQSRVAKAVGAALQEALRQR